jgi:hypothetical protein
MEQVPAVPIKTKWMEPELSLSSMMTSRQGQEEAGWSARVSKQSVASRERLRQKDHRRRR